jgi:hypothetical protein
MACQNRFIEFAKRHETKSYGVSIDQPVMDPRLENDLAIAGRAAAAHFVPDALGTADDEAVVMAVLPSSAPMMSSYDSKLGLVADMDKIQDQEFQLKCYIVSRPTCVHMNLKKLSILDPLYVSLLPTFKVTVLEGMPKPVIGDIIKVKYDNLTHTQGDFLKPTGINIADMFAEAAACEKLADKFDSPGSTPAVIGPCATLARIKANFDQCQAMYVAHLAAKPPPYPTKLERRSQLLEQCKREMHIEEWDEAGMPGGAAGIDDYVSDSSVGLRDDEASMCATRAQIAEDRGYGGRNNSGRLIQSGRPETFPDEGARWSDADRLGSVPGYEHLAGDPDFNDPAQGSHPGAAAGSQNIGDHPGEVWEEGRGFVPA